MRPTINPSTARLDQLIEAYKAAPEADKASVKHEIIHCHHFLSSAERAVVKDAMRPFLDEIEAEMLEKLPIAKELDALFKRYGR